MKNGTHNDKYKTFKFHQSKMKFVRRLKLADTKQFQFKKNRGGIKLWVIFFVNI